MSLLRRAPQTPAGQVASASNENTRPTIQVPIQPPLRRVSNRLSPRQLNGKPIYAEKISESYKAPEKSMAIDPKGCTSGGKSRPRNTWGESTPLTEISPNARHYRIGSTYGASGKRKSSSSFQSKPTNCSDGSSDKKRRSSFNPLTAPWPRLSESECSQCGITKACEPCGMEIRLPEFDMPYTTIDVENESRGSLQRPVSTPPTSLSEHGNAANSKVESSSFKVLTSTQEGFTADSVRASKDFALIVDLLRVDIQLLKNRIGQLEGGQRENKSSITRLEGRLLLENGRTRNVNHNLQLRLENLELRTQLLARDCNQGRYQQPQSPSLGPNREFPKPPAAGITVNVPRLFRTVLTPLESVEDSSVPKEALEILADKGSTISDELLRAIIERLQQDPGYFASRESSVDRAAKTEAESGESTSSFTDRLVKALSTYLSFGSRYPQWFEKEMEEVMKYGKV